LADVIDADNVAAEPLEPDKRFAMQIVSIVDEQGNRLLPLFDEVAQCEFPSFGLSGVLKSCSVARW
jgi:hypothetical protein